jgi:glycosyltransferase involved in cell wall biosynthesis
MPDTRPTISVIVPCYNYERYVGLAIESALAQTYRDREIIVVNDGSTDGSRAVLERYANRVSIVDQPNSGMIAAWHKGFASSRGDVIMVLDADDLLDRDALQRVAERWSPRCSKVQFDVGIIDAEGNDLGRRFCVYDASYGAARVRESFDRTGTYRWPVTVGNAYSRWFLEEVFPLTVDKAPEGLLNTVAPLYGDVETIPYPLGRYRLHGTNSWAAQGDDASRLPERIANRLVEVNALREHALRLGYTLPRENPLDHELAFINYRLLAWRLGMDYPDKLRDTPTSLLRAAARTVVRERYLAGAGLAHAAWFAALYVAPRPVALGMFQLRYKRASLQRSARTAARAVAGAFGRFACGAKGAWAS